MTYSIQAIEELSQPLPITRSARLTAQQFAATVSKYPRRSERVRLNTLAVCIVNDYLQIMGIPTDLTAGDSWNPGIRIIDDVADLEVTGLGRLECRPILPGEEICYIPPEVWSGRIGYVVVRIDESSKLGTLMGFAPPFDATEPVEELRITDLQPLEALLNYLDVLEKKAVSSVAVPAKSALPAQPPESVFQRWLNIINAGWQTLEEFFTLEPAVAFRRSEDSTVAELIHLIRTSSNERERRQAIGVLGKLGTGSQDAINVLTEMLHTTQDKETLWEAAISLGKIDPSNPEAAVRAAKRINLGLQLKACEVGLIIDLMPKADRKMSVRLQVIPTGGQISLPPGLRLIILDEKGEVFKEIASRERDSSISYRFSGGIGESLSVRVALDDVSVTEDIPL